MIITIIYKNNIMVQKSITSFLRYFFIKLDSKPFAISQLLNALRNNCQTVYEVNMLLEYLYLYLFFENLFFIKFNLKN